MIKKPQWHKLDNAAKIFPPNTDQRDTKVFRFSCELYEDIDVVYLQKALERTIQKFPYYCSILKRGLFWYYIENTERKPIVHIENRYPCSPLYYPNRKSLLFDVSYYHKRINLEIHHVLSDGSGALLFLRTLVFYYILEKHSDALSDKHLYLENTATPFEKSADSFSKYFKKQKSQKLKHTPFAYHIKGERIDIGQLGVIEGCISVKALLAISKKQQCTITEFLVALWIYSIYEGMSVKEQKKPVVINIPVNLRNYFPSQTTRNFFQVIQVSYQFDEQKCSLENVIYSVKEQFQQKLTKDALQKNMNALSALEHNIPMKLVPLATKDYILRFANWFSYQKATSCISNVGKINMPAEITQYIRLFDLFVSTKTIQIATCSFEDNFVISIATAYYRNDLPKRFFRHLSDMDLEIEITTNMEQEE